MSAKRGSGGGGVVGGGDDGGAVAERRLRPLWDAIDSRQYKSALKLSAALLAKHPDNAYLLVLKALVLERLGKGDEALPLCERAKQSSSMDERTLSTLQIVFQRLDRLDQATLCYQQACEKHPDNLELTMGLFNCYVREYNFLRQQQTAMKMYTKSREERFLLWAICSIRLQVCCGKEVSTLVQVAEALMKRHTETYELKELEALLVYISLLEQQGKHDAALEVLSSELGDLFSLTADKQRLQGKLLLASHRYKEAAVVFKQILNDSSDDWGTFVQFLDASLEGSVLSSSICSDDSAGVQSLTITCDDAEGRLQAALTLVQELQEIDSEEVKRGPFLAVLEIQKRLLLLRHLNKQNPEGGQQENLRALSLAIVDYFRRFGHLQSVTVDIENYLEFLDKNEKQWMVEQLEAVACNNISQSSVKSFRQKIAVHQVEVLLGIKFSGSNKDLLVRAINIIKFFMENLHFSKNLDPQENLHGEELLVISASLLIELFFRTKHIGYILEAILVLEFGLSLRRHSFQFKILVLNLYAAFSSLFSANEWYKSLEIKNILIETLSHHMLPSLVQSILWPELETTLKETIKFYVDYLKEAADLTILAYRHCNYSKVLEFVQFKNKMEQSHQFLYASVEEQILRLKKSAGNLEDVEVILADMKNGHVLLDWSKMERLKDLSFNEDLETRPWWSPAPDSTLLTSEVNTFISSPSLRYKESEMEHEMRVKRWRNNLSRRCLFPRLLSLSLGTMSTLRDVKTNKTSADQDVADMKKLIESFTSTLDLSCTTLDDFLSSLASLKMYDKDVNAGASDIMSLAVFWTAYKIASQQVKPNTPQLDACFDTMNNLLQMFLADLTKSSFSETPSSLGHPIRRLAIGTSFSSLVLLTTEALGWWGLCLQSWLKFLQPGSKKKKKGRAASEKSDSMLASDSTSLVVALQKSLNLLFSELEKLVSLVAEAQSVPIDQLVEAYLDYLVTKSSQNGDGESSFLSPGHVIKLLQSNSQLIGDIGDSKKEASEEWRPELYLKKIATDQTTVLSNFKQCLISRLDGLKGLKGHTKL